MGSNVTSMGHHICNPRRVHVLCHLGYTAKRCLEKKNGFTVPHSYVLLVPMSHGLTPAASCPQGRHANPLRSPSLEQPPFLHQHPRPLQWCLAFSPNFTSYIATGVDNSPLHYVNFLQQTMTNILKTLKSRQSSCVQKSQQQLGK